MEKQYIKDLLDLMKNSDVSEISVEKPDLKIKIKKKGPAPVFEHRAVLSEPGYISQMPITSGSPHSSSADVEVRGLASVKSPIVGTFYTAPSPGADPYVSIGDTVKKGQVICIIEAMKLMNEIESDIDGKVVEMLVENSHPVEFGEVLFLIEP